MPDENSPPRHTVTSTDEFDATLDALYPAASSTSKAFIMAAQDGATYRKLLENDLESYIREVVRDELETD